MTTNVTVTGTTTTVTDNGSTVVVATAAGSVWGTISGTLANQADLTTALAGKAPLASPDFSGVVRIGTPGASSTTKLQVWADDGTAALRADTSNDTPSTCAAVRLRRSRGTTSARTTVADGDAIGFVTGEAYHSTSFVAAARMDMTVDGAVSGTIVPSRFAFSTMTGAGALAEAMRINSGQELLIGYTADNGAYKLQVNSQIFATSATIATSDGRYKENIETLADGWGMVKALRPVAFDWKPQTPVVDGDGTVVREAHNFPDGRQVGFIAQEVQAALSDHPWIDNLVKENHRPEVIAADGTTAPAETFYGIAEGNLIAVLTSALQEAMTRIEALEARLAT